MLCENVDRDLRDDAARFGVLRVAAIGVRLHGARIRDGLANAQLLRSGLLRDVGATSGSRRALPFAGRPTRSASSRRLRASSPLLIVTLAASVIPALRAARADPVQSLRVD